MPATCSAHSCKNRAKAGSGIHFFRFPLNEPQRLELWVKAVGRKGFVPNKSSRLCNAHFKTSDFYNNPGGSYKLTLNSKAVPSIFQFSVPVPSKLITTQLFSNEPPIKRKTIDGSAIISCSSNEGTNYSDDSSDESDLDYKPPGEVEHLSEVESDDLIEDDDDDANTSTSKSKKTTKKRTKEKKGSQKKFKQIGIVSETVEETKEENTILNSSEEDKKRLDALWEEFQRSVTKKPTSKTCGNKSNIKEQTKYAVKPEKIKKRSFEDLFGSSDSSKNAENDDVGTSKPEFPKSKDIASPIVKKSPGGLANVLSNLEKKSKLTILEKSKQDWDGYKKEEGITEELITHNKGKAGFLEKRDFLERTDLRQFELEKAMRAANRSRRN